MLKLNNFSQEAKIVKPRSVIRKKSAHKNPHQEGSKIEL